MKRKIVVFANAWGEKCLSDALEGIKICAQKNDMDVFVLLSHAAPGMNEDEQREEKRIYQLPDLREFDGAIVFSAMMNFQELVEDIRIRVAEAGIPAVSVGTKVEGMSYVGMNNKESMCELVTHLVTEHNVRDVEFIGGPKGNENSDLRVEAVKEVFEKHQLSFEESHVHYGDWSVRGAMNITADILKERKDNMPDAVICANDGLAMAACAEIEKIGLSIPEDVIVTGFDNIYDGQIFFPSLCTVGQNDFIVGNCACETLMRMIMQNITDEIIIKNCFIKNQSCGCTNHAIEELRLKECKLRFYDKIASLEFGWSNGWLSKGVMASNNKAKIRENLHSFLSKSKMFGLEGTTYIIEDSYAELYLEDRTDIEHRDGYSDDFNVLAALDHRKEVPVYKMKRKEMIPGYVKQDKVSRMFMFLPAHFMDWVFGYVIVEDWFDGLSSGKMKIFADNFNHTVDKLKQNISLEHLNERLQELYTKDALTGMYNRFGYDSEGVKMFDFCREQNQQMVLMFTDINRMKVINDYYGHLQGDIAIKTVAEAISKNLPEGWIAIRFGGDEFLVVGQCDQEDMIVSVQEKITDTVRIIGKEMNFPFYLSVSCGYLHFVPEEERTLDSYIKETDEAMYEIKARMHMSDPELREFVEKCAKNPM